jgi:hypothetical protein
VGEFGSALKLSITRNDRAAIANKPKKYAMACRSLSAGSIVLAVPWSDQMLPIRTVTRTIKPDEAVATEAHLHVIFSAYVRNGIATRENA